MKEEKKIKKLRNPPILEAVIDISVVEEDGALAEDFNVPLGAYSKQKNINVGQITLTPDDSNVKLGQIGVRYKNNNNENLTDFRLNGFSYNHLEDYIDWDDFIKNALSLWKKYKKIRKKTEISRLGLRFINKINIPKNENLSEYFSILVNFPEDAKIGNISQHQYSYLSEFSDTGCKSIVNFVKQPNSSTDKEQSFLLDIDVFMQELNDNMNDEDIKDCLNIMRETKNNIFSEHLTDKAIEVYK